MAADIQALLTQLAQQSSSRSQSLTDRLNQYDTQVAPKITDLGSQMVDFSNRPALYNPLDAIKGAFATTENARNTRAAASQDLGREQAQVTSLLSTLAQLAQSQASSSREERKMKLDEASQGLQYDPQSGGYKPMDFKIGSGSIPKAALDKTVVSFLEGNKGVDSYVSPETYGKAKTSYISSGGDPNKFDQSFKQYRNPENPYYQVTDPNADLTSDQVNKRDSLVPARSIIKNIDDNALNKLGPQNKISKLSLDYLGGVGVNPEVSGLNQDFSLLKQTVVKVLQGSRPSNVDIKQADQYVPAVTDSPTIAKQKLTKLQRLLDEYEGKKGKTDTSSGGKSMTVGRFKVEVQ